MKKEQNEDTGLTILVRRCKEKFKIPENLNYYSKKDYRKAEKKFIKYALIQGNLK